MNHILAGLGESDIREVAKAYLEVGRLTEVPLPSGEQRSPAFDGEDHDMVLSSDLTWPGRIKGERGILIKGSVVGDAESPCRIEVGGDVIITGEVFNASISGVRIRIGKDVSESHLTSTSEIHIGGAVGESRLLAGDYDLDRKRIEHLRSRIERLSERAESLARRVAQDEKRLDKACKTLRIPLDFNVGSIVRHAEGKIIVDLSSVYDSILSKPGAQVETTVSEFFAKGIVGVLARTNRTYLVDYPAREKVFMQLLKSLHELFLVVVQRDNTRNEAVDCELELDSLVDHVENRSPRIAVGRRVAHDVEMEFILPQVTALSDGSYDFAHKNAHLQIQRGASIGRFEVITRGLDGARSSDTIPASDFEGPVFEICDGTIQWSGEHVQLTPA